MSPVDPRPLPLAVLAVPPLPMWESDGAGLPEASASSLAALLLGPAELGLLLGGGSRLCKRLPVSGPILEGL